MVKKHNWFLIICILGMIATCCFSISSVATGRENVPNIFSGDYPIQAYHDIEGKVQLVEINTEAIEPYFTMHSVEHYAYMDIHAAEEHLIPVILEARNRIIINYSWVDNSADGWITDRYGNLKEIVPHFNEIFPEDWENPWYPLEYNSQEN